MSHFDLAIIGSGSGNTLVTSAWDEKRVALVESGVFGGTCLNVGCIPTKMFGYAAEVAQTVREAGRFGIDAQIDGVRWADIRDRVFHRIDPISANGEQARIDADNVTFFKGTARFDGPRSIVVETASGTDAFTASQVVIATGSHPMVPPVITASGVPFHTSDTIMRIPELPTNLLIVGGGYVAAEFAHVFSALGVTVRIVTRGPRLLSGQDEVIADRFTELAAARWDVHLNTEVTAAQESSAGIQLVLTDGTQVHGDLLLVAAGRRPNSDELGLAAAGVDLHDDGRVRVDEFGRTTAAGVWSLGDASSAFQLKHVANSEARTVARNLLARSENELSPMMHRFVPSAVFTDPQIAAVGATAQQLRADGRRFVTAIRPYSSTAYGWAMEEQSGFCQLHADPDTGLLLGAQLLGPQAATLIQPLIQAMTFGQSVHDLARGQYWIHPALTEVVEGALLELPLG